jgi:hypothetical protein
LLLDANSLLNLVPDSCQYLSVDNQLLCIADSSDRIQQQYIAIATVLCNALRALEANTTMQNVARQAQTMGDQPNKETTQAHC